MIDDLKKEKILSKLNIIHNNKYIYDLSNYKNINSIINITCKIHGKFKQKFYNHMYRKNGCKKCNIKGHSHLTLFDFIIKANNVHNNKYIYDKVKYTNYKTNINIVCKKHGLFKQSPLNHISNKAGCPKCANNKLLTLDEFIMKSNIVHNNLYDYSQSKYISGNKKINIICKKHGIFKQTPESHLQYHGCPKCNNSRGELLIYDILKKNNIKFKCEHKFDDCINIQTGYKLRFDFYLYELNICIEYDGKQHFENNSFFNNKDIFKQLLIRDMIKDQYCDMNNIKLIRINYNNEIYSIIGE